jgi:outer membrane protein OmpA-like peptidoglycan-associated protein
LHRAEVREGQVTTDWQRDTKVMNISLNRIRRRGEKMKTKGSFVIAAALMVAALVAGCATKPEVIVMQEPGGTQQQVTVPKSAWTGAASGEQADALAKEIVDANNLSMREFDKLDGQLTKEDKRLADLQSTENKELQTAEQSLAKLEKLSNEQGTGQITLFFKTGSAKLDQLQTQRLITFLDYLSSSSRGRKVILLSIGSASAIGSAKVNKKLSVERSAVPLPIIDQYLVNIPHTFYKVTGIGDMYAPKGQSLEVEHRYQNVRIIAVYDTSGVPATPGS